MFYSIWTRARKAFRLRFDAEHEAFWDTAIAGPSGGALRTAMRRRLATEVAIECNSVALELLLSTIALTQAR